MVQLKKNIGYLFLLQFFNYVAPLLLLPYLTRMFGVEEFGVLSIFIAVIQLSFIVTDFGFSLYATTAIAKNDSDKEFISDMVSSILFIKITLATLLSVPVLLYVNSLKVDLGLSGVYVVLIIYAQSLLPYWFYYGIQDVTGILGSAAITKILYVASVFLMPASYLTIENVVLALCVSNLVASVYALYGVFCRGYNLGVFSFSRCLELLKNSRSYFFAKMAVGVYTAGTPVFLSLVSTPVLVGNYYIIDQVFKAGQSITTPFIQALIPYMNKERGGVVFVKLTLLVSSLLLIFGAGFYFVADIFTVIVFGEKYQHISGVLALVPIWVLCNFITRSCGYPLFSYLGLPSGANKSVYWGMFFFLCGMAVLVGFNKVSLVSVLLLAVLVEIVVFIIRIGTAYKLNSKLKDFEVG